MPLPDVRNGRPGHHRVHPWDARILHVRPQVTRDGRRDVRDGRPRDHRVHPQHIQCTSLACVPRTYGSVTGTFARVVPAHLLLEGDVLLEGQLGQLFLEGDVLLEDQLQLLLEGD